VAITKHLCAINDFCAYSKVAACSHPLLLSSGIRSIATPLASYHKGMSFAFRACSLPCRGHDIEDGRIPSLRPNIRCVWTKPAESRDSASQTDNHGPHYDSPSPRLSPKNPNLCNLSCFVLSCLFLVACSCLCNSNTSSIGPG